MSFWTVWYEGHCLGGGLWCGALIVLMFCVYLFLFIEVYSLLFIVNFLGGFCGRVGPVH